MPVPVIVYGIGAAALALAGWWGRGATEDAIDAYGPTPDLAPPLLVPPAAPVVGPEMSVPGQFTPAEMLARTQQMQRIANEATNRVREVEGSQPALRPGAGARVVEEVIDPLVWLGIAAAGVGVVVLVTK
jgi:hypothetical protein